MVLLGCAADASDPNGDPASTPTQNQNDTKTPAGDSTDPPPFDASFDETDGGSGATPPPANPPPSGDECIDKSDAGGSETLASKLPETDDCDGDGGTIKGVMNGAVDVDFYSVHMKDTFGCIVSPHFQTATAGLQVCVFVKCDNSGTTQIKDCGSGAAKTSDIGDPGCCFATPGTMDMGINCSGINDSATFFVKVAQNGGDKCEPYAIDYND
jgi:hypothetical protein